MLSAGQWRLNPIENVWAKLRAELASWEMADIQARRTLTQAQFRQRVSQILRDMSVPKRGDVHMYVYVFICTHMRLSSVRM